MAWKAAGRPVTTAQYETDEFATPGGNSVRFHALVHASIRLDIGGRHIYIDPVRKLGNRAVDLAAMPKADYILVTHEHGDHFDAEAIRLLSTGSTRLVTNQRCADQLGNLRPALMDVMKNGDHLTMADDFSLEAVPAYNTTEGHQQFHPKGRDNGFVITLDGLRIYVAGDTEDVPEMASLAPTEKDGQQQAIDVAFLPCNQPYTMTIDQLVSAAKVIKPKVLFPYHYNSTPVAQAVMKLAGTGIEVRIRDYK